MRLHIAIAGCGPAGLATALLLHRDGHRVTRFERFDKAQPVSGPDDQTDRLAVRGAVAGDRYGEHQLRDLDSER